MNKNIIKKHLTENFLSEDKKPDSLSSTEKIQSDSKKFNEENQKEVAKKMKSYEEPIKAETKPVKYEMNDEETKIHDEIELMNNNSQLKYGNEPSDIFKQRAEEAIAGSARMGNSPEYANVITADQAGFTGPDFGKKLVEKIKLSNKKRAKAGEVTDTSNQTSVSNMDIDDTKINNLGKSRTAIEENVNEGKFKLGKGYTHFAIFKNDNKIATGWDYSSLYDKEEKSYDNDSILEYVREDIMNDFPDNKISDFKIVTLNYLKKKGIEPSDSNNWYKPNINEGLSEKGKTTLGNWVNEFGADKAAEKLIDKLSSTGIVSSFPDSIEYGGAIDKVSKLLTNQKYDDAYMSAKKLADKLEKKAMRDMGLSENNINENKKEKMKKLVFKKEFKGVENALRLIPESYRVNGKEFHMTDGNENYEIKWEGSLTEGRAIITKASDKNLMNEDMQKMKHLMGYKSEDTLGLMKGQNRIDENKVFNKIWNKTKGLISENGVASGMQGFAEGGESNFKDNNGINDDFIAHGSYTVSNSGGYEVMLSDSGDAAKVRDAFGGPNPQTSDWLEIEYIESEDGEMEPVIDPQGYNIPLSMVMRVNR
jgi:hypothetical protein